eukprot:PhF_6_TR14944/c0_g1_i1/m.23434
MQHRCRVFIRDVPFHMKASELRNILEGDTDGCGEVLLLPDTKMPGHNKGYGIASYESFSHAKEASLRKIMVKGVPLRINIIDRPKAVRNEQGVTVTNLEYTYSATVKIIGKDGVTEDVPKSSLVPTRGLQLALNGRLKPQWCQHTLQALDCPFGEKCLFLHKREHQLTVHPNKRSREDVLSEYIIDIPQWKYLPLTDAHVQNILDGTPSADLIAAVDSLMASVPSPHGGWVVGLTTCLPTDAVLQNQEWVRPISFAMDKAVHDIGGQGAAKEARWNTSLVTLVFAIGNHLRTHSATEAVTLLCSSMKTKMNVQDEKPRLVIRPWYPVTEGFEAILTISSGRLVQARQTNPSLFFPKLLARSGDVESAIKEFSNLSNVPKDCIAQVLIVEAGTGRGLEVIPIRYSIVRGLGPNEGTVTTNPIQWTTDVVPKVLHESPQEPLFSSASRHRVRTAITSPSEQQSLRLC